MNRLAIGDPPVEPEDFGFVCICIPGGSMCAGHRVWADYNEALTAWRERRSALMAMAEAGLIVISDEPKTPPQAP